MKCKDYIFLSIVFYLSSIFTGCTANLTPIEVSERFWTAIQQQDAVTAQKYITSRTISKKDLTDNILPLDEFSLGRTVIDKQEAWVDTTVVISGDNPFSVPLKTVLIQDKNQWKVDYDATVASITKGSSVARVMGAITNLGEQFTNELNQSLEEIQEALPEVQKEIEKIEENVREKLPELRQRIDEFIRQLEEALENRDRERESRGTTEI